MDGIRTLTKETPESSFLDACMALSVCLQQPH